MFMDWAPQPVGHPFIGFDHAYFLLITDKIFGYHAAKARNYLG